MQLTLLAPGSVHPNPQNFGNGQTTGNGARPYINGNREQANNFILDGVDNNQASDNLVGYAPSPDAIQEFNLIEQNASAEFGNFMGGIVSTSIKAGSNAFHGDIFEFFRNDKLNANEWSHNLVGTPRTLLRWNEFGATLGGPIKRDKLFFFSTIRTSASTHRQARPASRYSRSRSVQATSPSCLPRILLSKIHLPGLLTQTTLFLEANVWSRDIVGIRSGKPL